MKQSFFAVLFLSGLFGCSESHSNDNKITIDPGERVVVDAGPTVEADSGPTTPVVTAPGSECGNDSDCEGGACWTEADTGLPGGYCTADCSEGGECPSGSACITVGQNGEAACLQSCDPAASTRQCRAGYGCADSINIEEPVCLPGCEDNSDCNDGLACDLEGGNTGEGSCYDPGATPGGACDSETDCPAGSACLAESFRGWPGGACAVFGCDPESGDGCGDAGTCVATARGDGYCLAACDSDTDCRAGYACDLSDGPGVCSAACTSDSECTVDGYVCNVGTGECGPEFDADQLGQACSRRTGGCDGGYCLRETDSGFPGAYCAYLGCDPAGDSTDCPGDGVCTSLEDGSGICIDGCVADSDCRDGYACKPVRDEDGEGDGSTTDPADAGMSGGSDGMSVPGDAGPSSDGSSPSNADAGVPADPIPTPAGGKSPAGPTACLPACTSDAQCVNDGFVCNRESGRCEES